MMTKDQLAKLDEMKQKHREEYKRVRDAIQILLKDPNAQIVFRHMAKISGFFQISRVLSPTNEINPYATVYNDGRRSLYLDFRKMFSDTQRQTVESKGEENEISTPNEG